MRIGIMAGATGGDDGLDGLVESAKNFEARGFATMWMANIFGIDAVMDESNNVHVSYVKEDADKVSGVIWYAKRTGTTWAASEASDTERTDH